MQRSGSHGKPEGREYGHLICLQRSAILVITVPYSQLSRCRQRSCWPPRQSPNVHACRHACLATARGNKGTDFGGIQKVRKPWFSRCFRSCVNWKRAFVRLCFMLPVYGLVCGCGYSGKERQRMREIEQRGGEYAARYVREKYGFTPEIRQVTACTERGGGAA